MKFEQITLALSGFFGSTGVQVSVDPFPAPRSIAWSGSGPVGLARDLKLDGPDNTVIQEAFERTLANIHADAQCGDENLHGAIQTVTVRVADLEAELQQGVDESYSLDLTKDQLELRAQTIWGALHAFSTLEQIVLCGENGLMVEGPVKIKDEPKYAYRGLHIDTSRNFYSIESLKRQIDALSLAKMNVFHWHLTDSQAWPIFIKSFPQMTKDAYSQREVYTVEDVQELVAYAKNRGVRVIPELDMPGHSAAGWKQVDPNYLVCLDEDWEQTAVEPTPGHLNILNPDVYTALEKIYNDVSELFEDDMFHVGFDELNTGCYSTSAATKEWVKDKSWSDLAQYWVDNALPIFRNKDSRRLMMWQDCVTSENIPAHSIPKDVILQAWSGGLDSVKTLASMGYDVVISSADYLYLDCGFGAWVGNDRQVFEPDNKNTECSYNYGPTAGSWCGPYKTWQRIYSLDLHTNLTKEESEHVLGASVALWSEQTDDTIVDGMVWPRTAALGELLWSGNTDSNGQYRGNELTQRILKLRERLVGRGIRAAPLMPKWCLNNPKKCDLA